MPMTALVFGWIGTVLVLSFNVPQVYRTCVRGLTAGVPASRAWVAIAVATVWLGYGLSGGGTIQIVLNAATIALNVILLVGLRATRELPGLLLVLLSAVATLSLAQVGMNAVGTVGAVIGSFVYLPQLLALRRTDFTIGVSNLALWLQFSSGLCWLTYGLLRTEAVVWVPNVFVLATTTWTVALLGTRTRSLAMA